MKGQMSIFDFLEEEPEPKEREQAPAEEGQGAVNFSCFSTFRNGENGVRYGECTTDHCCSGCEAHRVFYKKAGEYQEAGNGWGKSVALARRFFGIPTVPEYLERIGEKER